MEESNSQISNYLYASCLSKAIFDPTTKRHNATK